MLHPSTKKLIDRLSEMTARGKLNWQEGASDSVVYSTEGYSVGLSATPHELIITSKDGKELERASAEELAATPLESGGSYTDAIANMRAQALRIARGTETAISSLLADIELTEEQPKAVTSELEATLSPEATIEDPADESTAQSMFAADPQPISEPDTSEAEPDMTAAVARLADEVNTREQQEAPRLASSSLTAAATDLAVSVALAERADPSDPIADSSTEAIETEASEPPVAEQQPETEPVEPLDVTETEDEAPVYSSLSSETGAVLQTPDMPLETAPEDLGEVSAEVVEEPVVWVPAAATTPVTDTYVPFGLSEDEIAAAALVTVPPLATLATEAAPTDSVVEAPETTSLATEAPIATAMPPISETEHETAEPVESQQLSEPSLEPAPAFSSVEPEPISETSVEDTSATEAALAPVAPNESVISETVSIEALPGEAVSSMEGEPLATSTDTSTAPAEPEQVEPTLAVSDESESDPVEPEPLTVETTFVAEDVSDAVPPAETPETSEPRSYSLSGIGAGFGLGAMTSTVGATGGPAGSASGSPEKIIIDATDEVPLSDVPTLTPVDDEPVPATATAPQDPIAETTVEPVTEPPVAVETAPATETATTPAPEEAEPQEQAEPEAEPEVSLTTPRTRFNPWS